MWCNDNIGEVKKNMVLKRGLKRRLARVPIERERALVASRSFFFKHIKSRSTQMSFGKRLNKRLGLNNRSAGSINKNGALLHRINIPFIDKMMRRLNKRNVEGQNTRKGEKTGEKNIVKTRLRGI